MLDSGTVSLLPKRSEHGFAYPQKTSYQIRLEKLISQDQLNSLASIHCLLDQPQGYV